MRKRFAARSTSARPGVPPLPASARCSAPSLSPLLFPAPLPSSAAAGGAWVATAAAPSAPAWAYLARISARFRLRSARTCSGSGSSAAAAVCSDQSPVSAGAEILCDDCQRWKLRVRERPRGEGLTLPLRPRPRRRRREAESTCALLRVRAAHYDRGPLLCDAAGRATGVCTGGRGAEEDDSGCLARRQRRRRRGSCAGGHGTQRRGRSKMHDHCGAEAGAGRCGPCAAAVAGCASGSGCGRVPTRAVLRRRRGRDLCGGGGQRQRQRPRQRQSARGRGRGRRDWPWEKGRRVSDARVEGSSRERREAADAEEGPGKAALQGLRLRLDWAGLCSGWCSVSPGEREKRKRGEVRRCRRGCFRPEIAPSVDWARAVGATGRLVLLLGCSPAPLLPALCPAASTRSSPSP